MKSQITNVSGDMLCLSSGSRSSCSNQSTSQYSGKETEECDKDVEMRDLLQRDNGLKRPLLDPGPQLTSYKRLGKVTSHFMGIQCGKQGDVEDL